MSKVSLFVLFGTIAMIIVAVVFDLSFVAGGSGVILIVGLGYSYVVAKREVALLSYAVQHSDDDRSDEEETDVRKTAQ